MATEFPAEAQAKICSMIADVGAGKLPLVGTIDNIMEMFQECHYSKLPRSLDAIVAVRCSRCRLYKFSAAPYSTVQYSKL